MLPGGSRRASEPASQPGEIRERYDDDDDKGATWMDVADVADVVNIADVVDVVQATSMSRHSISISNPLTPDPTINTPKNHVRPIRQSELRQQYGIPLACAGARSHLHQGKQTGQRDAN